MTEILLPIAMKMVMRTVVLVMMMGVRTIAMVTMTSIVCTTCDGVDDNTWYHDSARDDALGSECKDDGWVALTDP